MHIRTNEQISAEIKVLNTICDYHDKELAELKSNYKEALVDAKESRGKIHTRMHEIKNEIHERVDSVQANFSDSIKDVTDGIHLSRKKTDNLIITSLSGVIATLFGIIGIFIQLLAK